jgi:hypothetical protein
MTVRKKPLTILCLFITVSTWAVEMKPWPGEVKPFGMDRYVGKVGTGFTIPQIDLDDRKDLQVEICPEPKRYMGHPSSVLLDDGKTMVIAYLDHHGYGQISWQRSEDAGKTWSERLPLPAGWDETVVTDARGKLAWLEVPIMYKIDGADGKQRICIYTAGGSAQTYPARYAVSEDGARTWSRLQPIPFANGPVERSAVLFSDMIRLKDGSYMATWETLKGTLLKAITRDGIHFSKPETLATYNKAFLSEGCFIRSPDGGKIAILMRENNRRFNSFISFSEDEGKTWSKPREMPGSLTGDRHQHTYAPTGQLFISFRDQAHETPTFGDWVGWVGSFEDLEKGNEERYRLRLKDEYKGNDCAYPTQHLLPDGTIFAATYGFWERSKPHYIVGVRLLMEELDGLYRSLKKNKS